MKLKCNRCKKEVHVLLTLKPIAVRPQLLKDPTWSASPKWTFMIGAECVECETHIKFVKQTDVLIKNLFDRLPVINSDTFSWSG